MNIFIPAWVFSIPLVYLGMGILLVPVMYLRIHRMMKHNQGWTWKDTIFGRRLRPFRWVFGLFMAIVLWPWAMWDIRPRKRVV